MTEEKAIELILSELTRAQQLHPIWPLDEVHAAAIVTEEAGELIQASLNYYYISQDCVNSKMAKKDFYNKMLIEAVHTGAMAVRFLMNATE